MIRKSIRSRISQIGCTYRQISRATGVPYNELKAYCTQDKPIHTSYVLAVLDYLCIGFGYKEVGVGTIQATTIKQKVSDCLINRGVTHRDFATYCNINVCTFSSWMSGKRDIPLNSLELIVSALGMSVYPQ